MNPVLIGFAVRKCMQVVREKGSAKYRLVSYGFASVQLFGPENKSNEVVKNAAGNVRGSLTVTVAVVSVLF